MITSYTTTSYTRFATESKSQTSSQSRMRLNRTLFGPQFFLFQSSILPLATFSTCNTSKSSLKLACWSVLPFGNFPRGAKPRNLTYNRLCCWSSQASWFMDQPKTGEIVPLAGLPLPQENIFASMVGSHTAVSLFSCTILLKKTVKTATKKKNSGKLIGES